MDWNKALTARMTHFVSQLLLTVFVVPPGLLHLVLLVQRQRLRGRQLLQFRIRHPIVVPAEGEMHLTSALTQCNRKKLKTKRDFSAAGTHFSTWFASYGTRITFFPKIFTFSFSLIVASFLDFKFYVKKVRMEDWKQSLEQAADTNCGSEVNKWEVSLSHTSRSVKFVESGEFKRPIESARDDWRERGDSEEENEWKISRDASLQRGK